MSSGSKRKSFRSLIVALRIARDVQLKTLSLSRVHLALIFTSKKLKINFSQLPGPKQGIIPCSLVISCNSQWSIENIFSHVLNLDFFHAWNIKQSLKLTEVKFSTRVISTYSLLFYGSSLRILTIFLSASEQKTSKGF